MAARLLLDMDPGVDDALALLLALRVKGVEVVGVCTSCGNVGAYESALNVLHVLDAAGEAAGEPARDLPVCVGEPCPLGGWPEGHDARGAEHIHGQGGMGDHGRSAPDEARLSSVGAVDFLLDTYADPANADVTLVVTGPLTNLATALRRDPTLASRIPRIVFMGGAFKVPGNIVPYGEFNVWRDPQAAAEVFAQDQLRVTAIGLDVCLQCPFTRSDLEAALYPEEWSLGGFVGKVTGHYMDFYRQAEGFYGCYLHDPLAMAAAIWPELVWTQPFRVDVITDPKSPVYGMTVIDHRARRVAREPTHDIAIAVDREQFMLRFRRALAPPPEWHEERRRKREAADGA